MPAKKIRCQHRYGGNMAEENDGDMTAAGTIHFALKRV
jgi:hypothetical protein